MTPGINAVAWLIWFAAVAVVPLTSRNPLYLGLLLLVVMTVFLSLPKHSGSASAWRLFAYIGSGVALLSVVFNVLTVHVGDRVLARLPDGLPIVGGALTLNALVYGMISAMAISSVLFAAATFNAAVRHADLVRLLPASLSRFGVAAGIALLFVPQTIAAGRDIYDAQRARGHSFRGIRDACAFVTPLLSTGLERALLLSEALETRGFGASAIAARQPPFANVLTITASATIILALIAIGTGQYALGMAAMMTSIALALYGSRGQTRRTRYRATQWTLSSVAVCATAAVSLTALLAGRAFTDLSLAYDTFPRMTHPGFTPLAGIAVLLLLGPALARQP